MDLAKARAEGIDLFTHKSSEGNTYLDPNFATAMDRAGPVNFPVVGAYHVLWPGNPLSQADDWFLKVDTYCTWWRDHPCWIWQIDAELFQNFKPYRQPSVDEINTCGDRIVARAGCKPGQVVVYAPEWLYGNSLTGLKYRCLWASNYIPSRAGGFQQLYPGDDSARWHAYSGITPTILQYTSGATIAGQSPADANAVRVNSIADLQALFLEGDPMSANGPENWDQADWQAFRTQVAAVGESSPGKGLLNSARDAVTGIASTQTVLQAQIHNQAVDTQTAVAAVQDAVAALAVLVQKSPALSGTLNVTGALNVTETPTP
jgi:Glycosyl hydrolases family 25